MSRRRRWILGTAFLLPVLGTGLAFALPPLDEYHPLDRVGSLFDPGAIDEERVPKSMPRWEREAMYRNNEEQRERLRRLEAASGVGRHRTWTLRLSETEADNFVTRLLSSKRGWRQTGTGSSHDGPNPDGFEANGWTTSYANGETGDWASFEKIIQVTPASRRVLLIVDVRERKPHPLDKLKRWTRLAFAR